MCTGVPTSDAGGNVYPGTSRGAMTSVLQLDNLQDCISGANSDQITKLFPKCRPRDINLNPLQQLTAQQDGQHDNDNNSLLRHRLSVVSVVMDAPSSLDRCVCVFLLRHMAIVRFTGQVRRPQKIVFLDVARCSALDIHWGPWFHPLSLFYHCDVAIG
jgi:hypothetical protein